MNGPDDQDIIQWQDALRGGQQQGVYEIEAEFGKLIEAATGGQDFPECRSNDQN